MAKNIAIIGGSGAIGGALIKRLSSEYPDAVIHGFSREKPDHNLGNVDYHIINYSDENSIAKPFQNAVPEGKLFTPEFSATKLLAVVKELTPNQSGKCFAWDGAEIEP